MSGRSPAALRRRVLTGLPPTLERRFTASPLGSGHGNVAAQPSTPEGARTGFVQPLSKASSMSLTGQSRPNSAFALESAFTSTPDISLRRSENVAMGHEATLWALTR